MQVQVPVDGLEDFMQTAKLLRVNNFEETNNVNPDIEHVNPDPKRKRTHNDNFLADVEDPNSDYSVIVDDDITIYEDDEIEIFPQPQTNEKGIKTLHCMECNFTTSKLTLLKEHMKSHNSITRLTTKYRSGVPCKECVFDAQNTDELKKHIVNVHKGLPCNNCGERFCDLNELRRHYLNVEVCKLNCLK